MDNDSMNGNRPSSNNQGEPQSDGSRRDERTTEMSGTAEASFKAAEGFSVGPELNTHPTEIPFPKDETGRHATDDWKKNKH
jgi:hypothetical protein